jgi:hypothetical protein
MSESYDTQQTAPPPTPNKHLERWAKRPRYVTETMRLTPLIGLAGLAFMRDLDGLRVVLYVLGIMLLIAATSHVLRKVLFPYLDLGAFVAKALEDSRAAGMVFLGMSFIIGMMIFSATQLLK